MLSDATDHMSEVLGVETYGERWRVNLRKKLNKLAGKSIKDLNNRIENRGCDVTMEPDMEPMEEEDAVDLALPDHEAFRFALENPTSEDQTRLGGAGGSTDSKGDVGGPDVTGGDHSHRGREGPEDDEEHHRQDAGDPAAIGSSRASDVGTGNCIGHRLFPRLTHVLVLSSSRLNPDESCDLRRFEVGGALIFDDHLNSDHLAGPLGKRDADVEGIDVRDDDPL